MRCFFYELLIDMESWGEYKFERSMSMSMIKKCLFIFIVISLLGSPIFASSKIPFKKAAPYQSIYMGEVEFGDKFFVFNAKSYPLYRLLGKSYIPLAYLENMGANIMKDNSDTFVYLKNGLQEAKESRIYFKEKHAYIYPHPVYLGNLRTYAIKVEEELLIPIEALTMLLNVTEYQSIYVAENKFYNLNHYISLEEYVIKNTSEHMLKVLVLDVFWDGKKYVDRYSDEILLEPYQKINREANPSDEKLIYITTIVLSINDIKIDVNTTVCYGQKNEGFLRKYSDIIKSERLSKLFTPYRVVGVIKGDIGSFKKGEKVVIWRAEKRQHYVIQTQEGKKIMLPCELIEVEGDTGVCNQQVKPEDIEDYLTIKGLKSKTNYILWTDIHRQRIYVLTGAQEGWKLQKTFVCSSGKNTHPTPTGIFELQYTIPYFGVQRNFRCKNAVVFFKDYMFHSILFDSTGKYVKEGKYQLGYRVSHGCVRLSEEDSAWIYRHVPLGTTVWIE